MDWVQLPYVQSPELSADSDSRERVGKTVTLQGNLDPCALYAPKVTTSYTTSVCICEFVCTPMAVDMVVLYFLSLPVSPTHHVNSWKAGISFYCCSFVFS